MSIIRGRRRPERELSSDLIIVGESPYTLDVKTGKWKTADGKNSEIISFEDFIKELKNVEEPEDKSAANQHIEAGL